MFLANGRPSDFFSHVQEDFHAACKARGPGHLVIRATGKKHAGLMGYINRRGREIECREFDSESQNIDELNTFLSTKPAEPMLVIIRGSMRAGITLGHNHHIRGWVETQSIHADTSVQSGAGRACGYNRTKETYPIYCDLDGVRAWNRTYDDLNNQRVPSTIPKGIQNHASQTRQRYPWKGLITIAQARKRFVIANRDNDKRDEHGNKIHGKGAVRGQVSSTSKQIVLDVAGLAMTFQRDSGATRAYYIDGPTTVDTVRKYLRRIKATKKEEKEVWAMYHRNGASYRELITQHPEVEGKVIELDTGPDNKGVPMGDDRTRDALQKRKSALRT